MEQETLQRPAEMVVQTRDLIKRFGHITALNDINIEVPPFPNKLVIRGLVSYLCQ